MTSRLVIRHARIIDGTGAPWFRGDLVAEGGVIRTVTGPGQAVSGERDTVIEAAGRYLAPGFIDAHTHDDLIALRAPVRGDKAAQGVTTVVGGNCSFSLFPVVAASQAALREHYGALLGAVAEDEVFPDFTAYADALDAAGMNTHYVGLVGHAALRLAVVGFDRRPATAAERQTMCALLDRQLEQGAAGLSLGLVYPPSAFADEEELLALAAVVARRGRLLAAHVRSYEGGLLDSVEEFLRLLRAAKTAGLLSHLQAAGAPYWGQARQAAARLEQERQAGTDVSFDMYPYPAGSSTILQLLPPSALDGGYPALSARLRDPAAQAALRRAVELGEAPDTGWESKVRLIGWGNVRISGVASEALKPLQGRTLKALADDRGEDPFDTLVDLILSDQGQTTIIMFQLSEEELADVLRHRLHMLGSDSLPRQGTLPHPRACGTFPRFIGVYALAGGTLPLEEAVRKMTSLPAQRFGLHDRGILRPGLAADLVLFGDDVRDCATFDHPTLPPLGLDHVWVGGVPVVDHGRAVALPPEQAPGRVFRCGHPGVAHTYSSEGQSDA